MCRISIVSSVQGGPGWTMVQLGRTGRRVAEVGGGGRKQQRGAGLEEKKLPVRGKAQLSNFCHPKKQMLCEHFCSPPGEMERFQPQGSTHSCPKESCWLHGDIVGTS